MSDVGLVRTMSVILLLVIITLTFAIFVALWHIIIHNLNVDVQHVNVSSCDRHPSDSCFHNRVNGVKSSETVCDLSIHDDVITDFYCKITSQSMKSVLPLKSVHRSASCKRLSPASTTTSSVESNISICFEVHKPLYRNNLTYFSQVFFKSEFRFKTN